MSRGYDLSKHVRPSTEEEDKEDRDVEDKKESVHDNTLLKESGESESKMNVDYEIAIKLTNVEAVQSSSGSDSDTSAPAHPTFTATVTNPFENSKDVGKYRSKCQGHWPHIILFHLYLIS